MVRFVVVIYYDTVAVQLGFILLKLACDFRCETGGAEPPLGARRRVQAFGFNNFRMLYGRDD